MLGALLWNASNLRNFKLGNLAGMLPANVDMRLGNLVLSETGAQGRSLSVEATSAHYYKDEDYFLLEDVVANIKSTDVVYSINAEKGRYEPDLKKVLLTGTVRTSDSKGRIITSEEMEIDMINSTFSSSSAFCMEDPTLSLSGASFVYNTNSGQLEVEGRVFMMITEDREPSKLASRRSSSDSGAPALASETDFGNVSQTLRNEAEEQAEILADPSDSVGPAAQAQFRPLRPANGQLKGDIFHNLAVSQ
jgi:LPS export ABC transporter protein LptC